MFIMKNYRFMILLALIVINTGFTKAQTIQIDTTQISFENKLRPSIGAQVDPGKDELNKAWADYLNKNYKIKLKGFGLFSTKEILSAEDVTIAAVSDRRMNLYTRIISLAAGSEIKIFASYGYDIFIGSTNYPKEYQTLRGILSNFLLKYMNDYYSDGIKSISKEIKSLSKDKVKLLRSVDKNNKKILKMANEIAITNATIKSSTEETIKAVEKTAKLTNDKATLENDNASATVKVQLIDEKLIKLNDKFDQMKLKRSNLI